MRIKKTLLIGLVCGLLSITFCLGTALAEEKVLRMGSAWCGKTLDIHKQGYFWMRLGVIEGLTDADQNLNLRPALAESWTLSDDKKTWTFKLRPNVKFHDGTSFNAEIMKFNLDRLMEKGSLLKNAPIESVKAVDELTLNITTTEPFSPLPAYLSKGETSPMAPSSFNADGEVVKLVGTGFFKIETWKVKDRAVVVANKSHWSGKKPHVDKVIYRYIPEAMTRSALLRTGELDIAQLLPPDMAQALAADPSFNLQSMPITRCRLIQFNLTREPFSDIRVRKAFNFAVNREDLIKYVLDGFGKPALTIFPDIIFWSNLKAEGFPFDQQKAGALLDEAGWKDSDGDGVRDKNGRPLSVKLVTYPNRAELPPLAEVIQNQLSKVGFKTELASLQVDAACEMKNKGDFDMFLVGRGLLFVPDPNEIFMTDYFSENTVKDGYGSYHYKNEEIDNLLSAARTEFDVDKRKEMYDRVQDILLADSPSSFLNYYVNLDVLSEKVGGYRMHPNEQCFRLETVELK